MYLVSPVSYLTAATFSGMALDYDLTPYTTTQLQDILNRASAKVNSLLRRDMLARERVIRVPGNGTNRLELDVYPVIYIKKIQVAVPGSVGLIIPADQVLIDYSSGGVLQYTPMYYTGAGYFARFPYGVPVDLTVGTGYGYAVAPPAFTTADNTGSQGLAAGTYNFSLTSKTMFGESTATVKQVTTTTGNILATITQTLGAYLYRAYLSSAANNTTLTTSTAAGATSFVLGSVGMIADGDVLLFDSGANAEYLTVATVTSATNTITTIAGAVYAHASGVAIIEQPKLVGESPFTSYGFPHMQILVNSTSAPNGIYQDVLPLTDTSAPPIPNAFIEATRLLAMSIIYEQNNLANRGVYMMNTNRKRVSWKSTEGTSGRGVPVVEQQAAELLKPYKFSGIL